MKKITLSLLASLISFCAFPQLAQEGFEGAWPPAGWGIYDNGIGTNFTWVQSIAGNLTQPAYEGNHAAYLRDETVSGSGIPEDWLVTPLFITPANPQLHFWSRLVESGNQGSIYRVMISASASQENLDEYTVLEEWTEQELNPQQEVYTEIVVPLPEELEGQQVYIAFVMLGNNGDRWLIDNIAVRSQCLDPENLTATDIGLTTATLTWDNPAGTDAWEIEIVEADIPPSGTGDTYNGIALYEATGLEEDTDYKYYVRALCADGGMSNWAGPFFFTTALPGDSCSTPISVTLPFSQSGDTAVSANNFTGFPGAGCGNSEWEDYLSGNDVVFEYTADFSGIISIDLTDNGQNSGLFVYDSCDAIGTNCLAGGVGGWNGDPVSLPEFPVTAGQTYYLVISSYSNPTTPYILTMQKVTCEPPVGLPPGNIAETSAELSWTNPTGATDWEIVVQDPGSGMPQGAGTPVPAEPAYTATGLTQATPYEYYVRADCADGTFSAWAGPYLFNTKICETEDKCTYTFIMNNTFAWFDNTMTVSQNGIPLAIIGPAYTAPGPVEVSVEVCNAFPLELFWNQGGTSQETIGIAIRNSFGQIIYMQEPGTGAQNSILYSGMANCDSPECLPPSGLDATNQTLTSAELSWAGPATGAWEVYIAEAGQPAPTAETDGASAPANPFTASGLLPATNYEYYVRYVCSDTENSVWGGPFAFSTAVCAASEQCSYTFEMISDWGSGWDGATMTISQNGTTVAVIGPTFTSGMSQSIIVPLCHELPFELEWTNAGATPYQVGVSVTNPFGQVLYSMLSGGSEPGTVLYTGMANCNYPACLPPTGLTALNTTMTSVDLAWESSDTSWEYYITEAGQPAPGDTTDGETVSSNTVTANGLTPATNYEFYVRTLCTGASSDYSTWTGPVPFSTAVCEPEEQCVFFFEMTSSNGWAGWEGNTVTVYQQGVPVATIGDMFFSGSSAIAEVPLCPDVEMELVWNIGGSSPEALGLVFYSPYLEIIYTKVPGTGAQGDTLYTGIPSCTPPACPMPQNLEVTDITTGSAMLNWQEMGSADTWEVALLPIGSPAPDTPGTAVNEKPYLYEGLQSGQAYAVYVRASCGEDGFSAWAGPFIFVTTLENDECSQAIPAPVNPGLTCNEVMSGTMTGASPSGVVPSCAPGGVGADVWFSFVAESESHSVNVNENNFGGYFYHAIYKGDNCGALTEIYCDSQISILHDLVVGDTYYIQVYVGGHGFNPDALTSFDVCIRTPGPVIEVNDSAYTIEELVEEVLINGQCGTVSNITSITGTDFGFTDGQGIGYFENNDSTFPLEKGIVLASGPVSEAPGPWVPFEPPIGSDTYDWPGDADLEAVIAGVGLFEDTYNATILEFDFTSFTNHVSFPFIFASDDFHSCTRLDSFVFLLTDENGNTQNIAVIPGTETPVSVGTIRDQQYSIFCSSQNPQYVGQYNGNLDFNPTSIYSTIDYLGQTVEMQAIANVIPGHTYHVKIVIADYLDAVFNAAVFIGEANFFDDELVLPADMTIADGTAICAGGNVLIDTNIDPGTYEFTWYRNNIEIEGANTPSLLVTQEGTYSVETAVAGTTCSRTAQVVIEFYPAVEDVTGNPSDITACSQGGNTVFDLSPNTSAILQGTTGSYTITYHTSAEDAANDTGAIGTSFETAQNLQTLYVRIENDATGCYGIKTFNVIIQELIPEFEVEDDFSVCQGGSGTITVVPANFNPDSENVSISWTLGGDALAETGTSLTVTQAGIYEVTVNNNGCEATAQVTVSIAPAPVADAPGNVTICDLYSLPALSPGNSYHTQSGGLGETLAEGNPVIDSQTIYVFAQNEAGCTDESSFEVTIVPTPLLSVISEECDGNKYVLAVAFSEDEEFYTPDNAEFTWTDENGTEIGTGSTLVITQKGTYHVRVAPEQWADCYAEASVTVDETTCIIPKGISPNGDGYNQSFDLSALDVRKLSIFNRYGTQVYSFSGAYTNQWEGQGSGGDELPTGTYFYMIERANGESKTGWVYINREE